MIRRRLVMTYILGWIGTASLASAQVVTHRWLAGLAAAPSGSVVVAAVKQDDAARQELVVAYSPFTGKELWRFAEFSTLASVAVSPDGNTVAVGLVGVADRDLGVLLLDAHTGKQIGGLGVALELNFMPGTVYPRFGDGVAELIFSPDGSLIYGLSNDTLFAWDLTAKKYLWIKDVPAVIEAPPDLPDPLPYGHATDFTLSPDGRQIAALRDVLRVAAAGRTRPGHFIERSPTRNMQIETAVFSADSRILAAGEYGTLPDGKTLFHATDLWINGEIKAVHIDGCGDGIAWTGTPEVFGCQNESGAHLRNLHDPQKNIGAAGPVSDLPILKVGNSLWSSAYKRSDWKDPAKPLSLTLVELGTGRSVTLTLPGRGPDAR
jgi:WD40 repeat protein